MKIKLFFTLVLFSILGMSQNTTYTWNCSTATPSSGSNSNIVMGSWLQGNNNGVTTMITNLANSSTYAGATGGENFGLAARVGALDTSSSGSAYFELTLTPNSGYSIVINTISFGSRSTSTGPQAFVIRSSLDGYASTLGSGTLQANSLWALNAPGISPSISSAVGTPVTIRIYGFSGTGTPTVNVANWRIDDITINVSSVLPSTDTSTNIYNADGSLTEPRTLSLNDQTLTFDGNTFNQTYNSNINPMLCPSGTSGESFSTINGYQSDVIEIGTPAAFMLPNYNNGYFKLKATSSNRRGVSGEQLNFGIGNDNSWIQSSSHYKTRDKVGDCGNDNSKLYLNPLGGKVAIGTMNIDVDTDCPDCDNYRLFVAQGIRTEKVRVDIATVKGWADYVFMKDYQLMPLNELENFIIQNKHLPNIPTAEEVVKKGIDLGVMNSKLLEKIEELTLHTIELNKKNESQQKLIDDLVQRLEKIEKNTKQ